MNDKKTTDSLLDDIELLKLAITRGNIKLIKVIKLGMFPKLEKYIKESENTKPTTK